MSRLPGSGSRGPSTSQQLRAEAERFRRRAREEARWGNDDLAPLREREFYEHAARLDRWADAAERGELR